MDLDLPRSMKAEQLQVQVMDMKKKLLGPEHPDTLLNMGNLASTYNVKANECSDPPYGHCSFYADCLEARYHCGPDGYPIGYGLKYSEKFKVEHSKLSTQGQAWMMNTMKCLQDTLIPEGTGGVDAVKTCNELRDKAFDSHARCYLENGLCALSPSDWLAVVDIVSLKMMFSGWEALKETLEAADGCLDRVLQLFDA